MSLTFHAPRQKIGISYQLDHKPGQLVSERDECNNLHCIDLADSAFSCAGLGISKISKLRKFT